MSRGPQQASSLISRLSLRASRLSLMKIDLEPANDALFGAEGQRIMALGHLVGSQSEPILNTARRILAVCLTNGLWVRSWKYGDLTDESKLRSTIEATNLLGVRDWKRSIAQVSVLFHSADDRHFSAFQTVDQLFHLTELGLPKGVPATIDNITGWETKQALFDGPSLGDLLDKIRSVGRVDYVAVLRDPEVRPV